MQFFASNQFARAFGCQLSRSSSAPYQRFRTWYIEAKDIRPLGRVIAFSDPSTMYTLLFIGGPRSSISPLVRQFLLRLFAVAPFGPDEFVEFDPGAPMGVRTDKGAIQAQNDVLLRLEHRLRNRKGPLTEAELPDIERALNSTPLKRLQFRTPMERFHEP